MDTILVIPLSWTVPVLIVQNSLIVFESPILNFVSSLLYFLSWGTWPILLWEKIWLFLPIVGTPSITTWDPMIVFSPIDTLFWIIEYGPIFTDGWISAPSSIIAVEWIFFYIYFFLKLKLFYQTDRLKQKKNFYLF